MLRGVGVAGRGIKSHVERGGGLGLPTGESRAMLRGVGVGLPAGESRAMLRGVGGWGCRQGNQEPC